MALTTTDITMPHTKPEQTLKSLILLRRRLQAAPGMVWLVVVPLLVFLLCQVCQLLSLPSRSNTTLLLHPKIEASLVKFSMTPASVGDVYPSSRLQDLERQVTERYLHVQLMLTASSGSLHPARGPTLADVGTLQDLRTFQPLLTPREKAHLLYLFELFSSACQDNYLTFFLLASSLVGSIRHHGVIPWSDVSIQIGMDAGEEVRILKVLDNMEGTSLMWPNPYSWTLRLKDFRPDPPDLARMPYLHIQLYHHNDTHLWADTWGSKRLFTTAKEHVFPLVMRPFEGQLTFTPCDPHAVLGRGELEDCLAVEEDFEEGVWRKAGLVQCDLLAQVFPFVGRRVAMTAQSTLEQVLVNGTLLSSVLVDSGHCGLDSHRHS